MASNRAKGRAEEMVRGARTALTLLFLSALLAGAAFWGWGALTEPLPSTEEAPVCEDTAVTAGQRVYADQVAVSVYNASTRSGLATRTTDELVDRGFVRAEGGNAPNGTTVRSAQIWTSDPQSPAVRLVRSYLGKNVSVVAGDQLGPGVVVVVGEEFDRVVKGKKSVKTRQDGFICSPPGSSE